MAGPGREAGPGPCPRPTVHDLLVAPRPPKGDEGQAAGGCMVQGHPDAPEIHGHPERLLLGLAKHGPLVHVRVLPENQRAAVEGEGMQGLCPPSRPPPLLSGGHRPSESRPSSSQTLVWNWPIQSVFICPPCAPGEVVPVGSHPP